MRLQPRPPTSVHPPTSPATSALRCGLEKTISGMSDQNHSAHHRRADALIVGGPPGAGKTTIARLLAAARARAVHVETVEEESQTQGPVRARSRRRTTPRGFADGPITRHIELRDGMLWRSRIVQPADHVAGAGAA